MSILFYEWKRYWKQAIKVSVLCAMIVLISIVFLPFVQETDFITELRKALVAIPGLLLSIVGIHENQDFSTPTRYLSFIHGFVFLIAAFFAAWLGGRVFAKEKADGTLDFLLAKPLHRWQIMVYKIAANLLVLITFCALYYAMYLGVLRLYGIFKLDVDVQAIPLGAFVRGIFFLQLLIFSISSLISIAVPTDKIAVPLTLVLTALFYLFFASAQSGGAFSALGRLSPFMYMQPQLIAQGDGSPNLVFLLLSLVFFGGTLALLFNNDVRHKRHK